MDDRNRPYKGVEKAADRIEALEAELARVTEDHDLWKQAEAHLAEARAECMEQARIIGAGGEHILSLQAKAARLSKWLHHDESCPLNPDHSTTATLRCTCGLSKALKGTESAA